MAPRATVHRWLGDRKSTRLNSSHVAISYAVFCLILHSPRSPLFPYTTLFRSPARRAGAVEPVEAMRTTESAAGSSLKVRTIIGLVILGAGIAFAIWGALWTDGTTGNRASLVGRSEEHTSELQSRGHLVCRLLLDSPLTQISTLSLHDALPISSSACRRSRASRSHAHHRIRRR